MVTNRDGVQADEAWQLFIHLSEECFLCGKTFAENEVVVYWHGNNTEITLHAKCAAELAAHLLSDATKAMLGVFNRKLEKVGFLPKVHPQKEQPKGE